MGAFQIDIPDGTKVFLEEVSGAHFEWQKGKIVADIDKRIIRDIDLSDEALKSKQPEIFPDTSAAIAKEHVQPRPLPSATPAPTGQRINPRPTIILISVFVILLLLVILFRRIFISR